MTPIDPNRAALEKVALALGEMLEEVVFLGGAAAGLLITDAAAPSIRPTKDIDCLIETASRADYFGRIRQQLLNRGFLELVGEGIPICAWTIEGIRLDVMPTDETILGFSNRWYEEAVRHADWYDLGIVQIRLVRAPYFVATKLAAFRSRGGEDYLASHDIEDLIAVVDGRQHIVKEVQEADTVLREHLATEVMDLLGDLNFMNALPGHVIDSGREEIVLGRLKQIAGS